MRKCDALGEGKEQNLSDGIETDLKFLGRAIVYLQGKKREDIILEILVHL